MDTSVEAAHGGDPVALTRLLVSTPSVNPSLAGDGAGEGRMAELTSGLLTGWGFDVEIREVQPGRPNVVGRLEGTGPTLLLNGHLDTVGIEGMTIDPFAGHVHEGRLYGRGACDMKGGVAALLSAASRLAAGGPRPNLVVALTADEEYASIGMAALVDQWAERPRPDYAVVCEPTSLAVMPSHKGFVWVSASFRGHAAHGSRPDVGVDAIRHAGLYLAALDVLARELELRPAHPLLGQGSFHAGTIEGGTAESVYPDACRLLLERRTMPGEAAGQALADFQAVLDALAAREPKIDATLEVTLSRPGTEIPEDHPLVEGLLEAGRATGPSSRVLGMTAWVDAAFLNEAGIPAVCYGPGSIEQAHTVDEWVDVAEVRTCAEVLERFARGLAS